METNNTIIPPQHKLKTRTDKSIQNITFLIKFACFAFSVHGRPIMLLLTGNFTFLNSDKWLQVIAKWNKISANNTNINMRDSTCKQFSKFLCNFFCTEKNRSAAIDVLLYNIYTVWNAGRFKLYLVDVNRSVYRNDCPISNLMVLFLFFTMLLCQYIFYYLLRNLRKKKHKLSWISWL